MSGKGNGFEDFLKERSVIPNEIKQFLRMVLNYCVKMEDTCGLRPYAIGTKHIILLIKSLRLIHAFFCYPTAALADITDSELIVVNQLCVKDLVFNEVKVENKEKSMITLERYCEELRDDEFWQEEFLDESFSVESLLREPAYYFLEMVRDVFKTDYGTSKIARIPLSILPNTNQLKPFVWAEDAYNPKKNFATSLCVQNYVRPLFLHSKLRHLRKSNKTVTFGDLKIFNTMDGDRPHPGQHKIGSETKALKPCASCQTFFSTNFSEKEGQRNFSLFGNCAEYDIIQTNDLLLKLQEKCHHWETFESACKKHLDAFKELIGRLTRSQGLKRRDLLEYFEKTRNTNQKALKYKWIKNEYKLVTVDYKIKRLKKRYPDATEKPKINELEDNLECGSGDSAYGSNGSGDDFDQKFDNIMKECVDEMTALKNEMKEKCPEKFKNTDEAPKTLKRGHSDATDDPKARETAKKLKEELPDAIDEPEVKHGVIGHLV